MRRPDILQAAHKCVCGDREEDYGTPENNFALIGRMWSIYLRAAHPELQGVLPDDGITALDVSMMMSLLKIARIATGRPKADNFVDLAGYAACAGELVTAPRGAPYPEGAEAAHRLFPNPARAGTPCQGEEAPYGTVC